MRKRTDDLHYVMADKPGKVVVSSLSRQFTADGFTVDVQIYKVEGNEGWTLEVGIDSETSVMWTIAFPTEQSAWEEFEQAVNTVGLRPLIEDDGPMATIH